MYASSAILSQYRQFCHNNVSVQGRWEIPARKSMKPSAKGSEQSAARANDRALEHP
jgi:hypothetical protein